MTAARFEILPFGKGEAEATELPERAWLTVTASPTHTLDDTVAVSTRLRRLGHMVTMHLASRMVRSREHLDEVLGALAEAGVSDAFVVGGDATPPEGPYASSLALLPLLVEHPKRPATIGIAGYPEGHPLIDDATLTAALREKSPIADYIATQLCYDAETLVRWVESIRAEGIAPPVHVSVPGMVDRRRLLEISARVGVGPSLRYLRKQGGIRSLFRLSKSSADRLYDALAPLMGESELNLEGFHYVTFNRLLDTWNWQEAKRAEHEAVDYDRSQPFSSRGGAR
jgi:methylenetetrahydrofolate reductase (NADPH)